MDTIIYGLTDEFGKVRYVGRTSRRVELRLKEHINDSIKKHKHVHYWIQSMVSQGLFPKIIILEKANGDGCKEEIKWIAEGKEQGWKLCNHTDGGEGTPGRKLTDEQKKHISESKRGKPIVHFKKPDIIRKRINGIVNAYAKMDQKTKDIKNAKISKALTGKSSPHTSKHNTERVWTKESKEKIAAKLKGRNHSEETKEKMSKRWTDDRKLQRSQEQKGKIKSKETKAKIAESLRAFHARKREM